MGREELAAALKERGEAEVRAIRQQVEAEVERYRLQRDQEVVHQGQKCDREAARTARQECRQVDWRVAKRLRSLRLQALQELDRRLWRLMLDEIDHLAPGDRQRLFAALAGELPERSWETVTVHPDDVVHAERLYPACQVLADRTVGAGLIVETDGGDIRVDNSLRCRLQKEWPGHCSAVLTELEREAGGPK